jgi:hypothetical protein
MIDALDSALANLLDDPSAPAEVRDSDASFEQPDRTYAPTQPTVNLFLVDVHQNLDLRTSVPVREPADSGYVEQPAPLRVDCRYLVTTWATTTTTPAQRVAEEHHLLGSVMSWLAQFPVLPARVLGPRLAGQSELIRLTVGMAAPGRELPDLWNALDLSPRAAIWLSAVLALPTGAAVVLGKPVTDVEVRLDEQESPRQRMHTIGGRVRGADAPLGSALVSIDSLRRSVSSDLAGVFRIGTVPEGTYELKVSAPDHAAATRTIHVPPVTGDEYDVQLVPEH